MTWQDLEPNVCAIRKHLLEVYHDIEDFQHELLPNRTTDIQYAGELINQEIFDVVVCGEVKKGKSSLINAIIGENVLPVDTEVATSQVFRIVNGDEKKFYLVFTDGSKTEISQDELNIYGSQVYVNHEGEIIFEHALEYILIEYPLEFLPKSIAIVDTPGIGALYATHEHITKQYLKKASAVIFVVDPQNPITEPEMRFVEAALDITNQIMFVMTKIDNYEESYITELIHRNKEILEKVADKTYKGKIDIYPISSHTLMGATEEDGELRNLLFEASQFETIRNELLFLIHSTICLSRNVYAFNVFNNYNSLVMNSIAEQTKVLSSPELSQKLVVEKEKLKEAFIKDWGKDGKKQKEIVLQINDLITSLRNRSNTLFSGHGDIYCLFNDEIDKITLKEANCYGKSLPKRLTDSLAVAWKELHDGCYNGIARVLQKYTDELSIESSAQCNIGGIEDKIAPYEMHKPSLMEHFNHCRNGYFSVVFVASLLGIANPVNWVLLPIGTIIAILTGQNSQLTKVRQELRLYLRDNLSKLHSSFCIDPISIEEPYSILQKTERELKLISEKCLEQIFNTQKTVVENSLKILNEQIAKQGEERKNALESLNQLRTNWNVIYRKLIEARKMLQSIETSISEQ